MAMGAADGTSKVRISKRLGAFGILSAGRRILTAAMKSIAIAMGAAIAPLSRAGQSCNMSAHDVGL